MVRRGESEDEPLVSVETALEADDGPSVHVSLVDLDSNAGPGWVEGADLATRLEGAGPGTSATVYLAPAPAPPTGTPAPGPTPDEIPVSVRPLHHAAVGFDDRGEIGRGGMGAIHCVHDRRLQRQLALKRLSADLTLDTPAARRFVEEAQVTGQLDHPNIVPVHELGVDAAGQVYFTMKLVRGKTLGALLRDLGDHRLAGHNLERLCGFVIKVCEAVAFAHSRGVIHRDLKPSNVMIGSHGQVYVMDWGLALVREGPRLVEEGKQVLGTPRYIPPEQARGGVADERSDVHGVGGILYTILTGEPPHPGENQMQVLSNALLEEVPPAAARAPGLPLPPELCAIAERALRRAPEERHPNVDALRRDLEAFQRGGGWLATRAFSPGEVITAEGDEATEAFVVVEGECEAVQNVDGVTETLRTMRAGDVIGETALLTGRPRSATVVALTHVTVKVVTRESLDRELERNAWIRALFHGLSERFRELDAILTALVGDEPT